MRRLKVWPGIVFGLIGINFCVVGVTVYAAHSRAASFVIESDYDRRALHWDDTARQLRHNTELGWTARIESVDRGTLTLSLVDKQGRSLEGASIRVEAFHHAHARDKIHAELAPKEPGIYSGAASIDSPGLWEFRLTVLRGPETFTQSLTHTVSADTSDKRTSP